jgi:LacI family transcriptional regulator
MVATIKDVSAKTGLGIGTISKYINGGKVKDQNRIAIERAIQELDFTVNEIARGLKTKHTKTVGVVIPEFTSVFSMSIVSVIEDTLRSWGYGVLVCDCRSDIKREEEAVSFLLNKKVDGIINIPVSNDGAHLKAATVLNLPIVLIDRKIANLECNSVLIDNVKAAHEATQLLIENGHRNIAVICGPENVFTSQERLLGYRQALLSGGIMPVESHIGYGNNTIESGFETMKKLLACNKELTALFVTNYEMTLGAIIALNECGLNIPENLSLIGFDNLDLAKVVRPKLTVVAQPIEEIGKQVSRLFLEAISSKESGSFQTVRLQTTIVRGESIKPM